MTGREQKELINRIKRLEDTIKRQAIDIADLKLVNSKYKVDLMNLVEENVDLDRRVEGTAHSITVIFDRLQNADELNNERFEEIENILEEKE